jgi:hypothetical protein
MQRSLLGQLIKGMRHEAWNRGVRGSASSNEAADVEDEQEEGDYRSNLDAMSCHSESEGSSDGASEGEAGEGGAGEEPVVSGGTRNLISGGSVRLCVVVDEVERDNSIS